MNPFRERLEKSASHSGRIILAMDLYNSGNVYQDAVNIMENLQKHICAVKMNFHLLLPLGFAEIKKITTCAQRLGFQCIADIKLNDIKTTNATAADILWKCGFDAIIANPIMGPQALAALTKSAHGMERGIISICHMSSYEGSVSYEMQVGGLPLYKKFIEWGMSASVDGFIVGATFPDIIQTCRRTVERRADILSPGVGAQGGSAKTAFGSGSDYIIVGRSLLNSENPAEIAEIMLE